MASEEKSIPCPICSRLFSSHVSFESHRSTCSDDGVISDPAAGSAERIESQDVDCENETETDTDAVSANQESVAAVVSADCAVSTQILLPSQLLISSSSGVFLSTTTAAAPSSHEYVAPVPPPPPPSENYATLIPAATPSTIPIGGILISQPLSASSPSFFQPNAGEVQVVESRPVTEMASTAAPVIETHGHGTAEEQAAPVGRTMDGDQPSLAAWPVQDPNAILEEII